MAIVNTSIVVGINSAPAIAGLQKLQSKLSTFNQSLIAGNKAAAAYQSAMTASMASMIGSTGQFTTSVRGMSGSVSTLGNAFDKGTLSAKQYFKYAASQVPGLAKSFSSLGAAQAQMSQLATSRVKALQTQYVSLGRDVRGVQKVMAIRPNNLAKGFATDLALAQQRAQLFNRAIQMGSTGLVNWGKNTQWAGRQLMVGFTVPLTIFAGLAAKVFKDLEKETIAFKKVYGDIFTSEAETEKNLNAVKALASEYTKYGIAVKDTMALANMAAQAGQRNADLTDATTQATRLAVLGQMESQEAMKTTISLQTAFGLSSEKLAESIDFLNIVENQSVLSLQDVAGAIPRVAPVIQALGGDVKDMAALLVAMKEGGVTAGEGANALKSSLGRLIVPTRAAREMASGFGIDLQKIVENNRGELLPMIQELATAMSSLGGLEQQQLLSQIFGKYQYARIGALFKSITDEGSQANRIIKLMEMSTSELAQTSEKELAVVEESVGAKFTAAVERLKVAIAPIGEMFLKAITPIASALSNVMEWFNGLSDGVKSSVGIIVAVVGGIAPVFLMGLGLIGNAIGNGIKVIGLFVRSVMNLGARLNGTAANFNHMTYEELQANTAMQQLGRGTDATTSKLLLQEGAVNALTTAYRGLASAAAGAAASMPRGAFMGPGITRVPGVPTVRVQGFNRGGTVPGTGNKDTFPAMLTPGEMVVNKEASAKYGPFIAAMNSGNLPGFNDGYTYMYKESQLRLQPTSENAAQATSVPSRQQVAPVLSARVAESIGQKVTERTVAAGNLDKLSKKVDTFAAKFSKRVAQHFDTTYKNVANEGERLSKAWKTAGKELRKEADLLARSVSTTDKQFAAARTAIGRYIGTMPDVYNTGTTATPSTTGALTQRRKPVLKRRSATTTVVDTTGRRVPIAPVQSYTELRSPVLALQSRMYPGENFGKQDLGHVGTPAKVPLSEIQRISNEPKVRTTSEIRKAASGAVAETKSESESNKKDKQKSKKKRKQMAVDGQKDGKTYAKNYERGAAKEAARATTTGGRAGISSAAIRAAEAGARVYSSSYRAAVTTLTAPFSPTPKGFRGQVGASGSGFSGTRTGVGPVQGTQFRVDGGVAQVYNPKNDPNRLGPIAPPAPPRRLAIDTMPASERRELEQSQRKRVVDNRAASATSAAELKELQRRKDEVAKGTAANKQSNNWLERRMRAEENLARQKQMSLVAAQEETKAAQRAQGRSQRAAIQAATAADLTPARGKFGSRTLGRIRDRMFPAAMGSSLRNVGIDPLRGVQTRRQISAEIIKQTGSTIAGNSRVLFSAVKDGANKFKTDISNSARTIADMTKRDFGKAISGARTQIERFSGLLSRAMGGGRGGAGGGGGLMGMFGGGAGRSPEERELRRQRAQGRYMGGGMALAMASMIPFMNADEEGKFMGMNANMLGMGMMGGGTLLSMAGILSPKIIALTAAVAAAGVAVYAWRNSVDNAARAAADFGSNVGGSANALKNMSEMLGRQTPAQRRTQMRLSFTDEEQEMAFGEFQNMFETDAGKKFIEDLEAVTSGQRFQMLSDYISTAVAAGIMDAENAPLFAKTVSEALGDAFLGTALVASLRKGFEKGSEGLLEMARERDVAIQSDTAVSRVVAGEDISYEDSASAIGSSFQAIQDFSNAAALAREEYLNGTISYQDYISVLNEATDAQARYSGILKSSIEETPDLGATGQALDSQIKLLLGEENFNKIVEGADVGFDLGWMENATSALDRGVDDFINVLADGTMGLAGRFALQDDWEADLDVDWFETRFGTIDKLTDKQRREIEEQTKIGMTQAVLAGMETGTVVAIQKYIKENPESRAAEAFTRYEDRGPKAQYTAAGIEANLEGMGGLTPELKRLFSDETQYVEFVLDFEQVGGEAEDVLSFINSIPEERTVSVVYALKGLTPEQRLDLVGNYQRLGNLLGTEAANEIDLALYNAAANRPTSAQPGAPTMGQEAESLRQREQQLQEQLARETYAAGAGPQTGGIKVAADASVARTKEELAEVQAQLQEIESEIYEIKLQLDDESIETLEEAQKANVWDGQEFITNIKFILETEGDLDNLDEYVNIALLLNTLPEEVRFALMIDTGDVENLQQFSVEDAQSFADAAELINSLPDSVDKDIMFSLMTDESGKAKSPKDLLKTARDLTKRFGEIEEVDDSKLRKTMIFELAQQVTNEYGEPISEDDFNQRYADLVERYGAAVVTNLPPNALYKAIIFNYNADQLRAKAAELRNAANALSGIGPEAADELRKDAEAMEQAAAAISSQADTAAAAGQSYAGRPPSTGGGSGGSGGGSGEEDPLKAMIEDLQTQKKLLGTINKENGELKSGFAQALRNAGAPEFLIAEIVSKGQDGIKIAKKLLKDKQKQLKELIKLSLDVARLTFLESQKALAGNLKTQSAAQRTLIGSGVDATVAIDLASDPEQAEMVLAQRQRVIDAENRLAEARKRGKGIKEAQKNLESARNGWNELTRSIKQTTKAQQDFDKESERLAAPQVAKDQARQQREAFVRQQAALTRLLSSGMSFEDAQEFAADETIALALVSTGREADAAARRVAYLSKKLEELKRGKRTNKNKKEIERVTAALKEAEKQADKTSKAYRSVVQQLNSLSKAQKTNLAINIAKEFNGLSDQLQVQLKVLKELTDQGVSYEQAMAIATDPEKAAAFNYAMQEALKGNTKLLDDLIAGAKRYDQAMATFSLRSKVFEFAEKARQNIMIPQVNEIAKNFGGQYQGLVSDYLMGLSPAELQAFFRLDPAEQKEFIDGLVESIPLAEKIKHLFEQISAEQKYQSLLNRDKANKDKGDIDALDDQLKAQRKLLKAEEDRLKVSQRAVDVIQEENDDLNRGLDLLSRQEEKINEAFDKRIEALDKVEQANARIAQQQQNQLNLSQALAQGDIYAATQAAQQIKQDNATAAIENTREALEEAREEQIKNLVVEVNGQLLTREQIEKRIESNNDRIYQIQEDQVEVIEAAITAIQDQIENIQNLKDAWQDYYDDLEKNAVDPLTGMKYSELEKIKQYYDALIATGLTAQEAFNKALAQYVTAGGKITDEARLRGYFGIAAVTPEKPNGEGVEGATDGVEDGSGDTETPEGGETTQDINAAKEAAILALPEVQKVLDAAKAIWPEIGKWEDNILAFAAAVEDTVNPFIRSTRNMIAKIGQHLVETINPELTPIRNKWDRIKDYAGITLEKMQEMAKLLPDLGKLFEDGLVKSFENVIAKIVEAIGKVQELISELNAIPRNIQVSINIHTTHTSSGGGGADSGGGQSGAGQTGGSQGGSSSAMTYDQARATVAAQTGLSGRELTLATRDYLQSQRSFTGGLIMGAGRRDSVPLIASPGEFVVRNAMVEKYGLPMLNNINQGSFEPSFRTPSGTSYTKINKPTEMNASSTMYNNNYSINVTANTNADADQIASATVMKIRQMNSMQIRGARG